ncbi:MAG: hypothetical protein LBD67_06515 [Candidatus Accumulibacter sp.]|jgi:hypothetical protein|nr:hypothetical protein [Accumulibacter sp.]
MGQDIYLLGAFFVMAVLMALESFLLIRKRRSLLVLFRKRARGDALSSGHETPVE